MADFCSLCGYSDQNIKEIYDEHIRPTIVEDIETLEDGYSITVNIGGVCEGCGLIAFGVNNKFEAHGTYYGEGEKHIFGYVDRNSFELIIDDNDPKYEKQRMFNKLEEENFRKQMLENDVKKDLYKSKAMAKFSHYKKGELFYNVELIDGTYQFPIATVETYDVGSIKCECENIITELSPDLGETSFKAEIKGSDLNRWIAKAIKNDKFIRVA